MDTGLIRECIETIKLIEGDEEQLSDQKIMAMRQNIEAQYKRRHRTKGIWKPVLKASVIAAACFILFFSLANTVAHVLGYD